MLSPGSEAKQKLLSKANAQMDSVQNVMIEFAFNSFRNKVMHYFALNLCN